MARSIEWRAQIKQKVKKILQDQDEKKEEDKWGKPPVPPTSRPLWSPMLSRGSNTGMGSQIDLNKHFSIISQISKDADAAATPAAEVPPKD